MRNTFVCLLLAITSILFHNSAFAGRCSGGANCTACSNCSSCKNCSEQGGTCSVCTNYDEPETEYVPAPAPAAESEVNSSDDSDYSDNYTSDYDEPKEEKSSYAWIWWTGGIIGGLWFLGSLGKK